MILARMYRRVPLCLPASPRSAHGLVRVAFCVPGRTRMHTGRCEFKSPRAGRRRARIPAPFSARAIRATLCRPAATRRSTARRARCPGPVPAGAPATPRRRAPCSGAARHQLPGTRTAGAPPRYRTCSRVWAAIAVRTRMLVPGEDRHRPLIMLGGEIDPAARIGHPQLHPVMLEQWRHQRMLARVPPPVRIDQRPVRQRPAGAAPMPAPGSARCQRTPRRSRPARRPGQQPEPAAGHARSPDPASPGRDPPVEREPQHPA